MSGIYEPLNEACRDRKERLMQEEDGEGGKEVEWNCKAEGGRLSQDHVSVFKTA